MYTGNACSSGITYFSHLPLIVLTTTLMLVVSYCSCVNCVYVVYSQGCSAQNNHQKLVGLLFKIGHFIVDYQWLPKLDLIGHMSKWVGNDLSQVTIVLSSGDGY